MVTRIRAHQVSAEGLAELGDIDARELRDRIFTDIGHEDRSKWDLRPSGKVDVSEGYAWTLKIDNPRLPGFPEDGIRIDHIGRYRPAGSDVWDWQSSNR